MKNNLSFANNPIMIGGCGSSGTSLLSRLLDAHPSIYCGGELYLLNKKSLYGSFFEAVKKEPEKYVRQGIPTTFLGSTDFLSSSSYRHPRRGMTFLNRIERYGFTREEGAELMSKSGTFKDFVNQFFHKVLTRANKNRWAEKTQTNCYCIGEFLSLYPLGRYIHVVRDGRDVVASLYKRGACPEAAVRRWMHDTILGFPYREHPRYFELKYEDLVVNPIATLNSLLQFIEEEPNAEMILENHAKTQQMNRFDTWTVQPTEAISNKAIGKWKHDSSYKNKRQFEQLFKYVEISDELSRLTDLESRYNANDILDIFGYDPSEKWDMDPNADLKVFKHYLTEKLFWMRVGRELGCRVSL